MGRRAALATAIALLGCQKPPPPTPPASPPVTVEQDAALGETRFTIESGDCRITWTLYGAEINRGVIVHRPACAWPLERQAPLLAALLDKALAASPERPHSLSWGRLTPDGPHDATMATRLAIAACRSAGWDAAKGAPKAGDYNGFVRQLANEQTIYAELVPLFRQKGFAIRLASIEKVLVLRAADLRFFGELEKAGVRARDKVPFDCQAWFSLQAAGPAAP